METAAYYVIPFLLLMIVVGVMKRSRSRRGGQPDHSTVLTDRRIDEVLDDLGVPLDSPGEEKLRELVRKRRKVQAVKAYRQMTGAGLTDAEEAVRRMISPA